jgi:predicted glycoside hydrolase/deacetylase ChbG (UPF0249 family)
MAAYEVVDLDDHRAVEQEVQRQLAAFQNLAGAAPTHLDSHQHVHRQEPVRSVLGAMALKLHVPLRHFSPLVRYCGDFYGQTSWGEPQHEAIGTQSLMNVIASLPEGITELACHPGYAGDLPTMYRCERAMEVRVLCDAAVRRAVNEQDVRLCSFAEVGQQSIARESPV